ncbi:MAG: transcription antitermination factor NusB [Armatimonadetes bacterium]|nr:transcription antitermination factor NusB [Armatimonadota bacterium]
MRSRRKSREAALCVLYSLDLQREGVDIDEASELALSELTLSPDQVAYTHRLIKGVMGDLSEIDETIKRFLNDYDIDRVAAVDRTLLRMAVYELYHEPGLAPAISINEAVELAKKYSTAASGKFVNGVLGALVKESPKAIWDPSTAPAETEVVEEPEAAPEPENEETVVEGSDEGQQAIQFGWKIRTDAP